MAQNPGIPEQFKPTKEETDAYRDKVVRYLTSMAMFKEMYHKELIDKSDYAEMEKMMATKYGISDKSIYRHSDPDDPNSFIKPE